MSESVRVSLSVDCNSVVLLSRTGRVAALDRQRCISLMNWLLHKNTSVDYCGVFIPSRDVQRVRNEVGSLLEELPVEPLSASEQGDHRK